MNTLIFLISNFIVMTKKVIIGFISLIVLLWGIGHLFTTPLPDNRINISQKDLWKDIHHIDEWYSYKQIDTNTYIIIESKSSQLNNSFVIMGDSAAILLDLGSGQRPEGSPSMRKVAESFIGNRMLIPMLTHFHFDHTGDITAFPEGLAMLELPWIKQAVDTSNHFQLNFSQNLRFNWNAEHHLPYVKINRWIKDGEEINLGNRTVKVLNMPGHSPESLVLVDQRNNYIFTGDFLYHSMNGGLVAYTPGSNLKAYQRSAQRLLDYSNKKTQFFGSHGIAEFDYKWAETLKTCLDKINAGEYPYRLNYSALGHLIPLRVYIEGKLVIFTVPWQ